MTAVIDEGGVQALAPGDGLTADQKKGGQEAKQGGGFQALCS